MRKTKHQQLSLRVEPIDHEHARELAEIDAILCEIPEVLDLVKQDIERDVKHPETGREGMTANQTVRSMIVKQMNGFSYEQLAFHLADSISYRAFCGYGLTDETPKKSTLQENLKRVKPETMEKVNRLIIKQAQHDEVEKGRKARIDSTVVKTNIHEPTDSSLLSDVVRVLARIMGRYRENPSCRFTNHSRRAKRRHMGIVHARKAALRRDLYRDLLKVTRKTVRDASRVALRLAAMGDPLAQLAALQLQRFAQLGQQVIGQTERRVLKGESVPAAEKIVSIFEPHTDIIVKDRRDVFYGHKVNLASGPSGLITDLVVEEGNPADSARAVQMVERQEQIYGRPPRQVSFDGGYASKENLKSIKGMGVKDVAFSKKRGLEVAQMAKSPWVYRQLTRFRAGVEAGISFLKRCFGLWCCTWSGFESFRAYVWSSVVTANLLILARHRIG